MGALSHWEFWALAALLLSTAYVQLVGFQIETLSGINRLRNLDFYRVLFGGIPWVQWFMFRYAGIIQIGCGIALFLTFGWRVATLTASAVLVLALLPLWHIARGHARQMLADIAERVQRDDLL